MYYDLAAHVGSISPGQTLDFQSGAAAADNPGAGIFKLTGSYIYRNSDPTDYARLVRSDASSHQVNCGSTPSTPTPTATPTPTPTGIPTPTPSPTPAPGSRLWGDVDCSATADAVDALKVLRNVAALSVAQNEPCPDIGSTVEVVGASPHVWGDVDCSGVADAVDALKLLRRVAALSVSQNEPCPDIGSTVTVGGSSPAALKIHHIDAEQGDAALIISPGGKLAMVDDGDSGNCGNVVSYLQSIAVSSIDYHFASHYHADHIGCLDDLASTGINVTQACYDRGGSYSSGAYTAYINTCGGKRQTLSKGQVVTLDSGSPIPVTLTIVDLDGAGVSTSDENALSVVLKLSYGAFDEVLGGDLTGQSPDVESIVGPEVGDVEVYKVHHHGSKYSGNDNWLNATTPEVGIISVGSNSYGHPTSEALSRLHSHGVKTYWTNTGSGANPDATWDKVGGSILIEVRPGVGESYVVSGSGFSDSYFNN